MLHGFLLTGQLGHLGVTDEVVAISPDISGDALIVARAGIIAHMFHGSSQDIEWLSSLGPIFHWNCDPVSQFDGVVFIDWIMEHPLQLDDEDLGH